MALIYILLRKFIIFLVKKGIVKPAVERMHGAHIQIFFKDNLVKDFATDFMATSRRHAKHVIRNRLTFTTGNIMSGKYISSKYREFYVQVYIRFDGSVIHSFAIPITSKNKKDAKLNLKHFSFKMQNVVLISDLIKHS